MTGIEGCQEAGMVANRPDSPGNALTRGDGQTFSGTEAASYVLLVVAIPIVLHFHLLSTVFAGLTVHVLTIKLARRLPVNWGRLAHKFALAGLATLIVLALLGAGLGIWSYLHGSGGMAALLSASAETLENLRRTLPPSMAEVMPPSVEDLRQQLTAMLREHSHNISKAGIAGVKTLVHVLFGMVIGGITALHHFDSAERWPSFAAALYARTGALADAFDKVVFAQVKISALNTVFTAIYLLVILPLFGVRLPLVTVLVPLTFVTGLLPVIGNLISNAAIVLISLGFSPGVGLASLVFLVVIHKLEYFFNAGIVGGEVQASAWELLSAMLVMEAVFGIAGLIAAPVVYAWLKAELRAKDMV
jgi:predicted PurR-regulated permease PerM